MDHHEDDLEPAPDEKELILRPDRQGLRMVLGDLEAEIMDVIWELPEGNWCAVRSVYETLLGKRRIAYTTVMNTMTRLAKKGVLESTHRDTAYLYRPRQSRDAFIDGIVGHVLERLLVQFTGSAERSLHEHVSRTPEEAETVYRLMNEIERRRSEKSSESYTEDAD